jgi:signal transduction histidine kinase
MSLEATAVAHFTAQLMRHIAEAPSLARAFAEIETYAQRCFPGDVRLDLLDEYEQRVVTLFSSGLPDAPPDTANVHSFVDWLSTRGYKSISTIPLTAVEQRHGWLVIARLEDRLEAEQLGLAGQLAATLALRLQVERERAARQSAQDALLSLERRQQSHDEVRLWAALAAGAAHDIGNLFASVMGHVQLLQQGSSSAPGADLRVIEQAARDGNHLLQRILSSHLHQPAENDARATLIPQVIHDALQLTRPLWNGRKQIKIETRITPIPPVGLHPAEMREVLVNLILNGIAAMPEGGTLTLSAQVAGQAAVLSVKDTGIGIAEAHQHTIFQPAATHRRGGNGLGLSVSRMIVERNGGTIDVSSRPGEGAEFTIRLPLLVASSADSGRSA